jgi:hypothetical protein
LLATRPCTTARRWPIGSADRCRTPKWSFVDDANHLVVTDQTDVVTEQLQTFSARRETAAVAPSPIRLCFAAT